jgi:hypothetical protein
MGKRRGITALAAIGDLSRPWTEEQARQVLKARESSGMTVGAFAQEQALPAHRIYWWQRRLGGDARTASEIVSGAAPGSFVPVTIRPVVSAGSSAPIAVVIGGARVEIIERDAVSAAWVAELVRALREVSS